MHGPDLGCRFDEASEGRAFMSFSEKRHSLMQSSAHQGKIMLEISK
jgi:hypothetical protein